MGILGIDYSYILYNPSKVLHICYIRRGFKYILLLKNINYILCKKTYMYILIEHETSSTVSEII